MTDHPTPEDVKLRERVAEVLSDHFDPECVTGREFIDAADAVLAIPALAAALVDHEAEAAALRTEREALREALDEAVRLLHLEHDSFTTNSEICDTCAFLARTDTGGQETPVGD